MNGVRFVPQKVMHLAVALSCRGVASNGGLMRVSEYGVIFINSNLCRDNEEI